MFPKVLFSLIPFAQILAVQCQEGEILTNQQKKLPNILLLIADDLGSADLGCFGNDTIRTPRIDQLAKEGVILTNHVTPDSVCTPNRAAFYTGRYPKRMGMVAMGRITINLFTASSGGLPTTETTFMQLAQNAGYRTALIGKWHLGLNCERYGDWCHHPSKFGFDYFYGLPLTNMHDFGDDGLAIFWRNRPHLPQAAKTSIAIGIITTFLLIRWRFHFVIVIVFFFVFVLTPGFSLWVVGNLRLLNSMILRNFEVIEQPIRLDDFTPRLIKEGTQFIEKSVKEDKPFLVIMSWSHPHTALITMPQFKNRSVHGKYGDAVEELDWSIGKMLDFVEHQGVADNTFVYFASDNSAHIEEAGLDGNRHGGYNGKLRGGKFHSGLEGAVRVPGIVKWPGKVPNGGQAVGQLTTNMDLFPTIANVIKQKLPDATIDGRDLLPLITNPDPSLQAEHDFIFHYCGNDVHAVRYIPSDSKAVYKMHFHLPAYINNDTEECYFMCRCDFAPRQDPPLLFDVNVDDVERSPITPSSKIYKEVRTIIERALEEHQTNVEKVITSELGWKNQIWRPWLQPCCTNQHFPFCNCLDDLDVSAIVADAQLELQT